MKSSRAVGERSFLRKKTAAKVKAVIEFHAALNGVKVYRYSNAGNHLHLVVKITNRALFAKFLRVISGLIARSVLGAEKASAKLRSGSRFWDARPFTRVAEWGKAFDILSDYIALNTAEAIGFVKYSKRDGRRKMWAVKFEPDPPPKCQQQREIFV